MGDNPMFSFQLSNAKRDANKIPELETFFWWKISADKKFDTKT